MPGANNIRDVSPELRPDHRTSQLTDRLEQYRQFLLRYSRYTGRARSRLGEPLLAPIAAHTDATAATSSAAAVENPIYDCPGFQPIFVKIEEEPKKNTADLLQNNPSSKTVEQPWIRGNVYSWPVGALFDHIDNLSDEWKDEDSSEDEDEDSDCDKTLRKKKTVTDIVAEMRIAKRPLHPEVVTIEDIDDDPKEERPIRVRDFINRLVYKYSG